jgi:hypothetical protein
MARDQAADSSQEVSLERIEILGEEVVCCHEVTLVRSSASAARSC